VNLLSRKLDYGILILTYLIHRQGSRPSAREIATNLGLSRPFVANILKDLCAAEYVASSRGAKGGYEFIRDPNSVNLADLFETLSGPLNMTECSGPHKPAGAVCELEKACPIRQPMARVHDRLRGMLKDVTLAEITDPAGTLESAGVAKS
jgi:Rrf2 family protein